MTHEDNYNRSWHPQSGLPRDPAPDQWHWNFGSHDGYDCMSAAYNVYRGKVCVFEIDTVPFIPNIGAPDFDWDIRHAPNPQAEALARAICQRMSGL